MTTQRSNVPACALARVDELERLVQSPIDMPRTPHTARLLLLAVLMGFGCRSEPPGGQKDGSSPTAASSQSQEEVATAASCGPGFRAQMIRGAEIVQQETAQTEVCSDDGCPERTGQMMRSLHLDPWSCDRVRDRIKDSPVVDAWGARARVLCNASVAQAISAGHDGKIGTCDDIGRQIASSPDAAEY